jgi:GNAT superfamily N-acetyltransferase
MVFEWATSLTASDRAQMLAIINAVAAREGTNGIPRPLRAQEGEAFMAAVAEGISGGYSHQLLARREADGAVVGIATLDPVKLNPARRHVTELKRMAVAPGSRGFGAYILGGWRTILDKCRELDCDIINIDVSEDGPHELWQKLGFVTYAKVADYARVGARRLDGYFLSVYVSDAYEILDRFTRQPTASHPAPVGGSQSDVSLNQRIREFR